MWTSLPVRDGKILDGSEGAQQGVVAKRESSALRSRGRFGPSEWRVLLGDVLALDRNFQVLFPRRVLRCMSAQRNSFGEVCLCTVILAWLLSLGSVNAESSVQELTSERTKDSLFSFLVEAKPHLHLGKHECLQVQVTVTLTEPGRRIPDGRFTGQLEIFSGEEFVSSGALQPTKLGQGRFRFTFSISPEFLAKSRFTFSETPRGANETGQGFFYWFHVGNLVDEE